MTERVPEDYFRIDKSREAKFINEKTPNSKIGSKHHSHHVSLNKFFSPRNQLPTPCLNSLDREDHLSSTTPETSSLKIDPEEISIANPFESHNTVESLLQPSFSPSVFINNSSCSGTEKTPSSFWNIDQIAVLKPIDIDLSLLHKQEEVIRLDPTKEKQAQQAIDNFFASHIDMPSPWSGERSSKNHYLTFISPSPVPVKKKENCQTFRNRNAGSSSISTTSSMFSSSHLKIHKFKNCNRLASSAHMNNSPETSKEEKKNEELKKITNASTQTALSLPPSIDLESVLGQYFTYHDKSEARNDEVPFEALSNSSLRRKLFFPDGEEIKVFETDEMDLNPLVHVDDDHEPEKFSPLTLQKVLQVTNHRNTSPLPWEKQPDIPQTPSNCLSHFSSSPLCEGISIDSKTPRSGSLHCQIFGSDIRHHKVLLRSNDDTEWVKMDNLMSPALSPVCVDGRSDAERSAMSMSYCNTPLQENEKQKKQGNHIQAQLNTRPSISLSSRRHILLNSPFLSPIENIKIKSLRVKKSSSINETPERELRVNQELDKLCPSPMLSPIPCGLEQRSVASCDEKAASSSKFYIEPQEMIKSPPYICSTFSEPMNKQVTEESVNDDKENRSIDEIRGNTQCIDQDSLHEDTANGLMDVSYQRAFYLPYSESGMTSNCPIPSDGQGDSGYSTTQSNLLNRPHD